MKLLAVSLCVFLAISIVTPPAEASIEGTFKQLGFFVQAMAMGQVAAPNSKVDNSFLGKVKRAWEGARKRVEEEEKRKNGEAPPHSNHSINTPDGKSTFGKGKSS